METFREVEVLKEDLQKRYATGTGRRKRAMTTYMYEVTGLLSFEYKEAQIRVMNTFYAGPPSPPVGFRTNIGVPGPVIKLAVSQVGSNFVKLDWQLPEIVNRSSITSVVLTGYDIGYQTGRG